MTSRQFQNLEAGDRVVFCLDGVRGTVTRARRDRVTVVWDDDVTSEYQPREQSHLQLEATDFEQTRR